MYWQSSVGYILLTDYFFKIKELDKVTDFCMGLSFKHFLKIADLLSGFIFYLNWKSL